MTKLKTVFRYEEISPDVAWPIPRTLGWIAKLMSDNVWRLEVVGDGKHHIRYTRSSEGMWSGAVFGRNSNCMSPPFKAYEKLEKAYSMYLKWLLESE